jgi:hypothetical protein
MGTCNRPEVPYGKLRDLVKWPDVIARYIAATVHPV